MAAQNSGGSSVWDGRDCVAVGSNYYLYYSTDYGASWSRFGTLTGVDHAHIARSSDLDDSVGSSINYTTYTGYLCFTRIGRTSYLTQRYFPYTAAAVCGSGDGKLAFACINQSIDNGVCLYKVSRPSDTQAGTLSLKQSFWTWDKAVSGRAACSVDGQYIVFGGASSYTNAFQSTNYGENWSECLATQSFGNGVRDVDCTAQGDTFVATTPSGRPVSNNYLGSWYFDGTGTNFQGTSIAHSTGLGGKYEYYYQQSTTLYRSSNWQTPVTLNPPTTLTQIRSNARGDKLIGLGSNGLVYYSHDYGVSWAASTGLVGTITEISMTKCI